MAEKLPSLTPTWHKTTYPAINPTQPHLSVKGKAILITGGGRGIGAQIARSFAAAGASFIAITGRTLSTLEATKKAIESEFPSTQLLAAAGDVTDEAAMESAFAALSQANSGHGVDICIHNAGYLPDMKPIASADAADWWSGFHINIFGSFVVTRAFLTHRNLSPGADPVLVGVNTAAIVLTPPPNFSGYAVSKLAQSRLLEAVAVEEPGIRVMQVHPGVVVTEMGQKSVESGFVQPVDDISLPADFIVWSTSPSAAWLAGKLIWCNWDVDELQQQKDAILSADKPGFLNMGMIGWPFAN